MAANGEGYAGISRKKHKKSQPSALDLSEVDEQLLLEPNYFYWTFIRPAEADAEARKKKRVERRARQKAQFAAESPLQPNLPTPVESTETPTEEALLALIETIIRSTHHAYGWRHLGELGQQLRHQYPTLHWSDYGCKKLIDFLQKYPALFKIKWSAPAHKGASHTWVRIAFEPKLKAGYKAK